MISFSFGNEAFNKKYGESTIDIVIASKSKYITAENFFQAAICHLDEVTYVGYKVADDYKDAYLKLGKYDEIISKWLSSMNEKIEINIGEILCIYRIKRSVTDWCTDEFLIETKDEFILLLWETSA